MTALVQHVIGIQGASVGHLGQMITLWLRENEGWCLDEIQFSGERMCALIRVSRAEKDDE